MYSAIFLIVDARRAWMVNVMPRPI